MKSIVIFSSKSGNTEKVAAAITSELKSAKEWANKITDKLSKN